MQTKIFKLYYNFILKYNLIDIKMSRNYSDEVISKEHWHNSLWLNFRIYLVLCCLFEEKSLDKTILVFWTHPCDTMLLNLMKTKIPSIPCIEKHGCITYCLFTPDLEIAACLYVSNRLTWQKLFGLSSYYFALNILK